MKTRKNNVTTPLTLAVILLVITACSSQTTLLPTEQSNNTTKTMHRSWDANNDGINDCEDNASCDHSVDYSEAKPGDQTVQPAFNCQQRDLAEIEQLICRDNNLAQFDQQLSKVFQQAENKVSGQMLSLLKAEQRGWIKGRNECWKADNRTECVSDLYQMRTAELQARFKLVDSIGPVTYQCGIPANKELTVTFYHSDPATLIANWQGGLSVMYIEPAASGAKYQGRNTLFWEHQGEAKVQWGPESPEMLCKK